MVIDTSRREHSLPLEHMVAGFRIRSWDSLIGSRPRQNYANSLRVVNQYTSTLDIEGEPLAAFRSGLVAYLRALQIRAEVFVADDGRQTSTREDPDKRSQASTAYDEPTQETPFEGAFRRLVDTLKLKRDEDDTSALRSGVTAYLLSSQFHAFQSFLTVRSSLTEPVTALLESLSNVPAEVLVSEDGGRASTSKEPASHSESSTAPDKPIYTTVFGEMAFEHFVEAFKAKWDEDDSDGMDEIIVGFVASTGAEGIVAIAVAAERGEIGSLHLAEAMKLLGRWNSDQFRAARSWLMKRFLTHSNASIRDGALSGLLMLEDLGAIPLLESAVSTEPVSELRRELERGIDYLSSL